MWGVRPLYDQNINSYFIIKKSSNDNLDIEVSGNNISYNYPTLSPIIKLVRKSTYEFHFDPSIDIILTPSILFL